jgi:hypothetical protein
MTICCLYRNIRNSIPTPLFPFSGAIAAVDIFLSCLQHCEVNTECYLFLVKLEHRTDITSDITNHQLHHQTLQMQLSGRAQTDCPALRSANMQLFSFACLLTIATA